MVTKEAVKPEKKEVTGKKAEKKEVELVSRNFFCL